MHRSFVAVVLAAVAATGCGEPASRPAKPRAADSQPALEASNRTAARLFEIVEEFHDQYLELNPLAASAEGDHRFDDRLGDYVSPTWMADSLAIEQEALEKLAAVDAKRLAAAELLAYDAFKREREVAVEGYRYPSELLPLRAFSGLPVQFALAGSGQGVHPFRTTRDYDHFLSRMDGFAAWVDQAIGNMRSGAARGVVHPRMIVERTIPQIAALLADEAKASVFWRPILNFPAGIPVADRKRLAKAYEARIAKQVLPAYRRLHHYLQTEYLPQARGTLAMSELPNGASWYAYLARHHTTTSMTPAEIHELGLREVARIRVEMEKVRGSLAGEGDLRSFLDALRGDPAQLFGDPGELITAVEVLRARVDMALPLLFAVRANAGLEIRPVEAFRAPHEAGASYVPPSADGRRPAVLYVNTRDLRLLPKYVLEALYLREAIPGRHLQVAFAQEATGLPRFQRFARDTAYEEGWALYAVSLGRDLGFHADALGEFGALVVEMHRAVDLIVDTGIHAMGWSREQAVDYYRANTALADVAIATEVERCVDTPGRALASKVGQLRILALRRRAQEKLGQRFDIRAFHTQLLASGSLPLPVLEAKIDHWIAGQV